MKIELDLSEEAIEILENVGGRMKLPDELPQSERLSLVIETLADSVDAQIELATTETGNPVAMQDAIDAVLNPDISTELQINNGNTALPELKQMTLKEIIEKGGMHGKEISDPIMQEAVVVVYNNIDIIDWNTATADRLVGETYELLKKKLWPQS